MLTWQQHLLDCVGRQLAQQPIGCLLGADPGQTRIHLAILREPYLSLILSHEKTIESRFSKSYRPPFERAAPGDLILLKAAAGPIRGAATVKRAWFFRRTHTWDQIRTRYGRSMCAQDDAFWAERAGTSYATLLELDHVIAFPDVSCEKRDRRGWVILTEPGLW